MKKQKRGKGKRISHALQSVRERGKFTAPPGDCSHQRRQNHRVKGKDRKKEGGIKILPNPWKCLVPKDRQRREKKRWGGGKTWTKAPEVQKEEKKVNGTLLMTPCFTQKSNSPKEKKRKRKVGKQGGGVGNGFVATKGERGEAPSLHSGENRRGGGAGGNQSGGKQIQWRYKQKGKD